jgi:hypothetical protein
MRILPLTLLLLAAMTGIAPTANAGGTCFTTISEFQSQMAAWARLMSATDEEGYLGWQKDLIPAHEFMGFVKGTLDMGVSLGQLCVPVGQALDLTKVIKFLEMNLDIAVLDSGYDPETACASPAVLDLAKGTYRCELKPDVEPPAR